jgi:hypothetical protein
VLTRSTVLSLALVATVQAGLASQTQAPKPRPRPKSETAKSKPAFSISVSKDNPRLITLRAEDAPLSDLAAELSRKLNVPVLLSKLTEKQRLTIEFEDFTLEAAIRILAPQSYIDYEFSGDMDAQPKALTIYLNAHNEAPPPLDATVKGGTTLLMIEGNTEDGVDAQNANATSEEEEPLKVSYERHLLSVVSKKQPLTVVLYDIAKTIGIPFDLVYESTEVVDTSFSDYRPEEAIRRLSPNVRLFVRTDLQRSENTPLRLVLAPPARTSSPSQESKL